MDRRYFDIAATTLLSVAALATSWAGYQATKWSGDQAVYGSRAATLRAQATLSTTAANQLRAVDAGVFVAWLGAAIHGDSALARAYQKRFRPEFARAFDAWIATDPLRSANAAPTPFALSAYKLASADSAVAVQRAADSIAALGLAANATSDSYILDAVLLAAVMFFAQTAQQAARPGVRVLMLVCALLFAATGLTRLLTSPPG